MTLRIERIYTTTRHRRRRRGGGYGALAEVVPSPGDRGWFVGVRGRGGRRPRFVSVADRYLFTSDVQNLNPATYIIRSLLNRRRAMTDPGRRIALCSTNYPYGGRLTTHVFVLINSTPAARKTTLPRSKPALARWRRTKTRRLIIGVIRISSSVGRADAYLYGSRELEERS